MDLPAHTRERVAELRATHHSDRITLTRTGKVSWWRALFAEDRCRLCRQVWRCSQIRWCDQVESGRRDPAGWRP